MPSEVVNLARWYGQYEFVKMLREKTVKMPETTTSIKANNLINSKVSLWQGDITRLPLDAIVTAANSGLRGGGGVDGAVHRGAGPKLLRECSKLGGCPTGNAKITEGYNLPAKKVIHAVGPMETNPKLLGSCYLNSLNLCLENKLRTLAFPCISTGIYGYPNDEAAHVALSTVRSWIESHIDDIDLVVFCVFLPVDYKIYSQLVLEYFPPEQ